MEPFLLKRYAFPDRTKIIRKEKLFLKSKKNFRLASWERKRSQGYPGNSCLFSSVAELDPDFGGRILIMGCILIPIIPGFSDSV
jgi:hypothetical protein